MRTVVPFLLIFAITLSACAEGGTPSGGSEPPAVDARRIEIYGAVIRDVVEFRDGPVYVWTELCDNADAAASRYSPCPDSLMAAEQQAIVSLLADEVAELRFIEDTEAAAGDVFDGEGGELVRLGPIEEVDGRIQVPAMHLCGNVCGGGSVWVVEETSDGWAVAGSAPGYGEWIS